ncbi:hypothetical protein QQA06_14450 [Acinetobacter baumannii]|uniref:hypothetical protein n=1 Tax=Acinetobacter baumannii TaxID=470 RepID=UPI00294A6BFB|nr:hypothetical protein [Acinetobacter baumannii]MDV5203445.1 hypothetical protein [Acinetobacter baumannii]MDV5211374.1 hypothetical protein [Acinetobacter baumannii]MDV5261581.1 hypothetical protein [Acinetobacter baumannii]MDV5272634.1 hypothetical protein [Acinetobacter baumannii]
MSEFKEYKVNDKVIVRKNKTLCLPNFNYMDVHTVVHVVDIPLGQRVRLDSFPEGSYVSSEAIDFATTEEIAAGHRIDNCKAEDV